MKNVAAPVSPGPVALAYRRLRNAIRPAVTVSKAPPNIYAEWNVPVTMSDGVTLRVNIFRPEGGGRFPVIMSAHPYGKDRIPRFTWSGRGLNFQFRLFPQPDPMAFSDLTGWEAPDPAYWVAHGYCVVNADLRGSGRSEGIGDLMTVAEARDYYELIEWAGRQDWSNGRVGLDGVSYLALSQYGVAALRPPHLAAICPWEGFSDIYRDFVRPGGVRENGFSLIWTFATRKTSRLRTDLGAEFNARADRDAWWEARTPCLEKIKTPMLVCGSFSDQSLHTRGSFEVFRRAGSTQKWLYTHRSGKWSTYYGKHATETRRQFFDHTLKGLENGWSQRPPVRIAIHDQGAEPVAVTEEATWPPANLEWRDLWLDARTHAMTSEQAASASSVKLRTPSGVAAFHWQVPEDLDIIGPMSLRLCLEVKGGGDADLFVAVRKLRAGSEVKFEGSFGFSGDVVTKGWQRVAHRALDQHLSTPNQPVHKHDRAEPLQPGEIAPISIELRESATRFLQGDVLELSIRGNWPFARDPLRGQFPTFYKKSPNADCVLHTGGLHDTCLRLGARPTSSTVDAFADASVC